MDLNRHVESLTRHLLATAAVGGEATLSLATQIAEPFATAARGTLLDVLADATAQISRDLAPGSVDVRLRGREAAFVVTTPDDSSAASLPPPDLSEPVDGEGGTTSRINFRPPEWLKTQIESAARAQGLSVNTYLIRTLATVGATPAAGNSAGSGGASRRGYGDHFTGWVQ